METKNKTLQLHKGLGSGKVEIEKIVDVDMGYTIRVCNPEGIETQRFVVADPEGDEERRKEAELCEGCELPRDKCSCDFGLSQGYCEEAENDN